MIAIGIDLGTTNSLAAIDDGDGKPRILQTSMGENFTPSVVSFKQDELLAGRLAWNNASAAPRDTIFSIKRLMGRSFNSKEVAQVRKQYPYSVVAADDPDDSGVRVLINGIKYSPEDISAMILRQVVEDASKALGKDIKEITHAVITVPAYFSEIQREATRKAGEQAGLIVKKIIDEPTAAAIAFGMNSKNTHNLLVFDMGGGTLDISILFVGNQEFVDDAKTGDMWLGGDNFDSEIITMITEWVNQKYGVDPSSNERFLMQARRKAEETKCLLTENQMVNVNILGIISLDGGINVNVSMTISRPEFEKRIRNDVKKGINLLHDVMKKNDLDTEDISTVLLVGGTTYIPLIQKELAHIFGQEKIRTNVNPMEAVALGAAILATQLEGVECPSPSCRAINSYESEKCNKCGHSLATARDVGRVGQYGTTERDMGIYVEDEHGEPDKFSVIIPEGTKYPLKDPMQRRYTTTSRKIIIPVYVGDKSVASQNEYMGLVEYELPPDVPDKTPVVVNFNYDRNRILSLRIEVEGRPELTHDTTPKRHAPDSDKMDDEKWRISLRNAIASVENMIERYGEFIEPAQKQRIEQVDLQNARNALLEQNQESGHEALNKLLKSMDNIGIVFSLQMADLMMQQTDADTSSYLARQSKSLRDAYRKNEQDRVILIKKALDVTIMNVFEKMPATSELKQHSGLLRLMDSSGKSSQSL